MMQTCAITVPAVGGHGQQKQVLLNGQLTMVTVPDGSEPHSKFYMQFKAKRGWKYALTVPPGVGPGQLFQATVDGQLCNVTVPDWCLRPNSTFHVQIPARTDFEQKGRVSIETSAQRLQRMWGETARAVLEISAQQCRAAQQRDAAFFRA